MKFYIQRLSNRWGEEPTEPCRDAFPSIKEDTGKVVWWVEVRDLDHLMAIQREVGEIAITQKWITILD